MRTQADNAHPFTDPYATGKRRTLAVFAGAEVANLAVRAIAVPAEITVGNAFHVKKLEAAQDDVVFRDVHHLSQHFNRNETLIRLEDFCWRCGKHGAEEAL